VDETPHILSRDDILRAEVDSLGRPLLPTERVDIPEWGGTVIIRGLTGTARDTFEGTLVRQRGRKVESNLENFRSKLLVQSIVDEQGNLLFSEKDVQALGRKSAAALERAYTVAMRLSRLTPEDVEELTETLGEEKSDGSGSDLQDTSDYPSLSASNA
jgi:hypothetical protein